MFLIFLKLDEMPDIGGPLGPLVDMLRVAAHLKRLAPTFPSYKFLFFRVTELESAAFTGVHLQMKTSLSSMKHLVFCPWYVAFLY